MGKTTPGSFEVNRLDMLCSKSPVVPVQELDDSERLDNAKSDDLRHRLWIRETNNQVSGCCYLVHQQYLAAMIVVVFAVVVDGVVVVVETVDGGAVVDSDKILYQVVQG